MQMAKRMNFSVFGLPHYTIWHLYEPTLDDLKHMEELDREREQRQNEEAERAEIEKKTKDQFRDTRAEWEADGATVHGMAQKADAEERSREHGHKDSEDGTAVGPEKASVKEGRDK
jgi:mannan polymerase II complex ANP1 subunit